MSYEYAMYTKILAHSACMLELPAVYYTGQDVTDASAIQISNYGNGENLSIECMNCHEVIIDIDRPIYGGE